MRELKLSDAELQALIAPALLGRLLAAGFETRQSDGQHRSVVFPVAFNFAGIVSIERDEDGTWTFRQEVDEVLANRSAFTGDAHEAAFMKRETAPCR